MNTISNSIKYIPSKDYKGFTAQLKKIYGAVNLKAAIAEFDRFKETWKHYPGAVAVWERNWIHVEQLFNYGSAVRRVMYTTNAIESVNSSFRKVTRKGAFPHENAVRKILYLRILELYKKWQGHPIMRWSMVRNQLAIDEKIQESKIEETQNLSRLYQHTKNKDTFAIIGSQDQDTKQDRSDELKSEIGKAQRQYSNVGYNKLEGTYTYENGEQGIENSPHHHGNLGGIGHRGPAEQINQQGGQAKGHKHRQHGFLI